MGRQPNINLNLNNLEQVEKYRGVQVFKTLVFEQVLEQVTCSR
nr:MAG TPA: hypothetical protein [Caudoviricetes sp.]